MRTIVLAALLFCALPSMAAQYLLSATNSLVHGQDGWVHDWNTADGFDQGYYLGWAYRTFTGAGTASATLTLGTNWPAGPFALWAMFNEQSTCDVTTTVEGVSNTVSRPVIPSATSEPRLFRLGIFTNSAPISNIVMDVTVSGAKTIFFHSLLFTDDLGAAPVKGGVADFPLETHALYHFGSPTDVAASEVTVAHSNLIANSSFAIDLDYSFGAARSTNAASPWSNRRRIADATTDDGWVVGLNTGYDTNAFAYNIYSDWFDVHSEFEKRTEYTLSIWSKCLPSGNTCIVKVTPQFQPDTYSGAAEFTSLTNTTYQVNYSPTTSYSRKDIVLPLQGGRYRLELSTVQNLTWYVDKIMLTKGAVTNDWVAKFQAEYTLQATNINGDYDISATVRPIQIKTYNTGAQFTRTVYVTESTLDAVVLTNYTVSYTVPAGHSTNQWNVMNVRQGPLRITTYVSDQPGNEPQELVISGLKQRVGAPTLNTHFAYHSEDWEEVTDACARIGFQLARTLGNRYTFETIYVETSPGVYDWTGPDQFLATLTNGAIPILSLAAKDSWPSWWTNGDGTINTNHVYNFQAAAMARYNGIPKIWEMWNEPQEDDEAFVSNPTNLANVIIVTVQAWLDNDPDSELWVLGGVASVSPGSWAYQAFDLLPENILTNITTTSWHQYSQNEYLVHENYDRKPWNRRGTQDAMFTFNQTYGIPKIANSESGFYDVKANLATYPIWAQWLDFNRDFFAYADVRRAMFVDGNDRPRIMMRWVMRGARYTFYKGSWLEVYPGLWSSSDGGFYPNFTWSTATVAVRNFEDVLGYGDTHGMITNTAMANAEGYLGKTEAGQSIVVCWSETLSNIVLTLTNSAFGVCDQFGNQLQTNNATVTLTPRPVYLLSSVLATNELKGAWEGAAAYMTNTTRAPDVMILRQPFGQDPPNMWASWVGGNQGRMPTYMYPDEIQYCYSLDGVTWTDWSTKNAADLSGAGNGTHTLRVRAKDSLGNIGERVGLSFSIGAPRGKGAATSSGTVSVGSWNFTE